MSVVFSNFQIGAMGNIVLFFFCNNVFFLLKRLFLYWNYSS